MRTASATAPAPYPALRDLYAWLWPDGQVPPIPWSRVLDWRDPDTPELLRLMLAEVLDRLMFVGVTGSYHRDSEPTQNGNRDKGPIPSRLDEDTLPALASRFDRATTNRERLCIILAAQRALSHAKRRAEAPPALPKCANDRCGREFLPATPTQTYCNQRCQRSAQNRKAYVAKRASQHPL